MLQVYNSLTNKKEPFSPIDPDQVRMYVCGMTVYDYCHLGHARAMVIFDVVLRYLREQGYRVTYVRNITDIEDKIIKRAKENGESVEALTDRFIKAMNEDFTTLGVLSPDAEPRATEYVQQMQDMIAVLLDKGYAYQGKNGDVYYDVSRFDRYGALSGKQIEDLRAGARVEIDEAKDDPLDFVLWKAAKPGEPTWESPWGPGRPGWHIECSAMSTDSLGGHFDIHGGGPDLIFPHHENEIAQSEGATGKKFVNTWMHVGLLQVDQQKMSKSLGNFFTIREVVAKYEPEEVRYFLLSSHYRSPLNFSRESLDNARSALTRLYLALRDVPPAAVDEADSEYARHWMDFSRAMDDDFNTPEAFAVLFDLVREMYKVSGGDAERAGLLAGILRELGGVLGLLQGDPNEYLQGGVTKEPSTGRLGFKGQEIEALIEQRAEARRRKDWAEADRIRDELKAQDIVLEDGPGGTTWRRE